MAADSDGCILTTVVTCEGDLSDPGFTKRFEEVVGRLNGILGETVKVHKLEPWNSVRVTLSIPREAALRLRKLASEGSAQLRALGILSVQVEGDQVISLRIASGSVNSQPQEIILQTTQDGSSGSRQEADGALSRFLSGGSLQPSSSNSSSSGSSSSGSSNNSSNSNETNEKVQFKSPNVVCPPDSVVPKVPVSVAANSSNTPPTTKAYAGPFPFASMNQAIHSRENLNTTSGYTAPPPPYPGKHPPAVPQPPPTATMSSPLLVNLLQNDGSTSAKPQKLPEVSVHTSTSAVKPILNPPPNLPSRTIQNSFVQKSISAQAMVGPGVRTVTNRTIPNAFIQKPTSSNIPNSLPPRLLASNSLESEISLNITKMNVVQQPFKPGPPITHVSQASTSSPSALSNTSIRQNNKLSSTTPNSAISTTPNSTPNSHMHYPMSNNIHPPAAANVTAQPVPAANLSQASNVNSTAPKIATPTRILPPPPPYTVAVNRPWDSLVQASPFLDLTPSLTDLKVDDLEDLLPTLECDLARSPPEIPEILTRSEDKRNFLINPLTGELEPQSSGESDAEELSDVFTGLPSPAAISDEDTNSTIRPDTTDQSDSETRSSHSDSGKHSRVKTMSKVRDRGRDSPGLKPEKIKLRLKLEKSEPINPAYKVDVSFIQQPKKASASVITPGEELRVPPLHISLRGRNHAYITNKKKSKLNADGSSNKVKARKIQDVSGKTKKSTSEISAIMNDESASSIFVSDPLVNVEKTKQSSDPKKVKKFKSNHDHKETLTSSLLHDSDLKSKLVIHNSTHYKEKQKERRGSDSELARASLKFSDSNGIISIEKKRRLSQSEPIMQLESPAVLGSTNVGTIATLPQKPRKEKNKIKDAFKNKEIVRSKNFMKSTGEKLMKQVVLPTGEIDMEAKFKQRLMEGSEKGIPRPPHRTENVHQNMTEDNQIEKADKLVKAEPEPPPLKDKSPEPDKCNTPDRKQPDLGDKQSSRSPNSGAQGEDSGIESMDALSEKSPNQASQSPHAGDIPEPIKSKTQVPDILDIEAQLAKMEGLNGIEDVNENQHDSQTKLGQCCELTSALQDSLKQGAVSLSVNVNALPANEKLQQAEVSLVPLKSKTKEEDLEPLPVRVTPPLYTYSNPDKGRGSESPTLSDEDSNTSCSNMNNKSKSLLEQLLIEIPDNPAPSSPSPATRSVRTRALSKLNSPELSSPVSAKSSRGATPASTKRKRHESENSNNSLEDSRNKKPRKCSENAAELIKACMGVDPVKLNNVKKPTGKLQDESSDSDEPLIEKVRKTSIGHVPKNKIKAGSPGVKSGAVNTRRSVRAAIPTPNTRSKGDKIHSESEALRRKTRSAVLEGESKRKKEVK